MDARATPDLRLRDIGIKQPQCTAIKKNGEQCKKKAVTGAVVCATHGGSAPQVREAGKKRVMEEIESRLAKAWKIVDSKLDEGDDVGLAWKIISAQGALEARMEPQNANPALTPQLEGSRAVDPRWAVYAE